MNPEIERAPLDQKTLRVRATVAGTDHELFGPVPDTPGDLIQRIEARPTNPERRAATWSVLQPQWAAMDLPPSSQESLRLLGDPETRVVITGQQPAVAGGPLFLFAKALSASRLARSLREAGIPAVPIFWIADEDHDVGELFGGILPGATPDEDFRLDSPFDPARIPIADLRFEEGNPFLAELEGALQRYGAAGDALARTLRETDDPSPAVAFRQLLLTLLEGEGILPLHPSMLRSLQAGIIQRELQTPGLLARQAAGAMARQRTLGLSVPIPHPADLPFFVIGSEGNRHRLVPTDGGFQFRRAGSSPIPRAVLEEALEREPHRFSPDALLRPLVQDELLEPVATIVGPTELGYHLQLAHAYRERGLSRPIILPRLGVRVLETSERRALRRAGLEATDLTAFSKPSQLVVSPVGEDLVQELRGRAAALLEKIDDLTEDATPAPLRKRAQRLGRRWRADLEKLEESIHREIDDAVGARRQAVAAVHASLWPGGKSAERQLSVLHYLARFGPDLFEHMGESVDATDPRTRILTLAPRAVDPEGNPA